MPDCAFCSHSGKLSAEHIVAKWMRELFPDVKQARYGSRVFRIDTLDWKAKVVCEQCNNGWMSDIEALHGKPVLTPFICWDDEFAISESTARSIALYAFKNAVILDHAHRHSPPFFPERVRYDFRQHLIIPDSVGIWICPYPSNQGGGNFKTTYGRENDFASAGDFQMYVCTFALGFFVAQVVAVSFPFSIAIKPSLGFEHLEIPVWPVAQGSNFVWRRDRGIRGVDEFNAFVHRWDTLQIVL